MGRFLYGGNQEERLPRVPALFVKGQGIVDIVPDTATFDAGFKIRERDLETAQAVATERMTAILEAIRQFGVADRDLKTSTHRVTAVWEYDNYRNPIKFLGYQIEAEVTVTVRELTVAGSALSAAVNAGASEVSELAFRKEDSTDSTSTARDLAVKDALAKARQMTSAAGVRLGRMLLFEETTSPTVAPDHDELAKRSIMEASAAAMPVEGGTTRIEVTVEMAWELEQDGYP